MTIVVTALQTSDLRKGSALFDIDKQWSRETNFVLYDFNNPEDIPVNIHNTFDCVVIDPPFITEEVWTLYAAAAKLLLAPGGRLMLHSLTHIQFMGSSYAVLSHLCRGLFCSARLTECVLYTKTSIQCCTKHVIYFCRPHCFEYNPRE